VKVSLATSAIAKQKKNNLTAGADHTFTVFSVVNELKIIVFSDKYY